MRAGQQPGGDIFGFLFAFYNRGKGAEIFDAAAYETLVTEIGLTGLPDAAKQVLAGKVHGRIIVKV